MAGFIHIAGVIFYYFFASGELQPWAEPKKGDGTSLPGSPANEPAQGVETTQMLTTGDNQQAEPVATVTTINKRQRPPPTPARPHMGPVPTITRNSSSSRDDSQ